MISPNDGDVRRLFGESNIGSYDAEKYARVLDAVLTKYQAPISDVLAVSQTMGLVVVLTSGVVRADQRGIFNKRIEVGELIPFRSVTQVVCQQRQPRGRESWIQLFGSETSPLTEIGWYTGGPVDIPDAARERDRVYRVMVAATGRR